MKHWSSKVRHGFGASVAAVALLVAACGGGGTSSTSDSSATSDTTANEGSPVKGGTLTVGLNAESSGFDPQSSLLAPAGRTVAHAIFDTLTAFDAEGVARPFLASSVTPNADSTEWTIVLRPNIKFHDGTPLNAAAVKANFDAGTTAPTLKNAYKFLKSTSVVDDLTVLVTMDKPFGLFPNVLAGGVSGQLGYMAAPSMLADPNGSRNPVGTGPFVFKEWVPDDHLTVTRNDSYWSTPAWVDEVVFKPINDNTAMKAAFDAGTIDVFVTAGTSDIKGYKDDGKTKVVSDLPAEPDIVIMNTSVAPFDDLRIRKAMVMSTDLNRVLDFVEGTGVKELAAGPYSSKSYWFTATDYPTYDLEGAKALVAEYVKEKGPIKCTYTGRQIPFIVQYMELLSSMWKAAGIDCTIESLAQPEVIKKVFGYTYQVANWGGIGGGDPDNDYSYFTSGGTNLTQFKSPTIDAAMDAGRATGDPVKRKAQYDIVQKELGANVPYIWLNFNQFAMITQPKVNGVNSFMLPDGTAARPQLAGSFQVSNLWLSDAAG